MRTMLIFLAAMVTSAALAAEHAWVVGTRHVPPFAIKQADGSWTGLSVELWDGLASDLGVPEGPAFGKLSAGQSVTVDGETVSPEEVHTERTRQFPVEDGSDPGR